MPVVAAWFLAAAPGHAAPAVAAEVVREEITVASVSPAIVVGLHSPAPARLAPRPRLLLFFSADRNSSLPDGRYGEPGKLFLAAGHRVASFDLPAHGGRVDAHGSGIAGLCAGVVAGAKPFDRFVAEGRAVIDELIRRGLAEPGRVMVAGVSRGGYCAVRLAAADPRVAGVAALAPVTDWRVVQEFQAAADHPAVASLALGRFADALVGRRIFVAIGNHDPRVSTDACTRFVLAVGEAERRAAVARSGVRYVVADDSPGHALAAKWRHEGVRFLLEEPAVAPPAAAP